MKKSTSSSGDSSASRVVPVPVPRGPLAPWGSIQKYMGDSNICDLKRKEIIEQQICKMILRSGLPLGFAENPHFQDLVGLLCPAYVKSGNAFPGALVIFHPVLHFVAQRYSSYFIFFSYCKLC